MHRDERSDCEWDDRIIQESSAGMEEDYKDDKNIVHQTLKKVSLEEINVGPI
jgi:hypothetical protein